MDNAQDLKEHSAEMQLPLIRHFFPTSCVCVLYVSTERAADAAIIRRLLTHPKAFTVVSSDFCHWGKKFAFEFPPTQHQVRQMDLTAIQLLADGRVSDFEAFVNRTKDTICGIAPLLLVARANHSTGALLRYNRSEPFKPSSVSYASIIFNFS